MKTMMETLLKSKCLNSNKVQCIINNFEKNVALLAVYKNDFFCLFVPLTFMRNLLYM